MKNTSSKLKIQHSPYRGRYDSAVFLILIRLFKGFLCICIFSLAELAFIAVFSLLVFTTNTYGEAPRGLPSPCYAQAKQAMMAKQDMLKQMRNMRPAANAQIQRHAQQQTQSRIDYSSQINSMMAPYIARANGIRAAAAGCASIECAASVHSRSSAFLNDVTNNLLPQLQTIMADMRREMSNSTAMSVERLDDIYKANAGSPLPSSRGGTFFPPLCREFQPIKMSSESFGWSAFRSAAVHGFKNVKDWNEKNGVGLGEWTCVGSLAMGNVRCFERQKDPQGMGRSCEKAGGQIIACYDNVALWTPASTSRNSEEASWVSWFDKKPPVMRVMVGGATVEERNGEDVFKGMEKEIQEMKMVAPLLRPSTEQDGNMGPMHDVPLPWEVLEKKILSGMGISAQDAKNMTDGDWDRYKQLQGKIEKESQKTNTDRAKDIVVEAIAATKKKAGDKVDEVSQWTRDNRENIESTVEMMETMAFIAGPVGAEAAAGIGAVANTATVISKMMIVKADDGKLSDYARELVLLLGPEHINKLGKKGLIKSVQMGGFDAVKAEQIVNEASDIAEFYEKAQALKGAK